MARKRIIKGQNAEKVEKRIAEIPEDINAVNIFKVLKKAENNEKKKYSDANTKKIENKQTEKQKPNLIKKGKQAISFNQKERCMIKTSCEAYRNSLPIYLRSVQKDLKIIDGIIQKLE